MNVDVQRCPLCGATPSVVERALMRQEGSGTSKRLWVEPAQYVRCCGAEHRLELWQNMAVSREKGWK